MIIAREKGAPSIDVPEPNRRTLKVLLSPLLHEGLGSIASGLTILPPGDSPISMRTGRGSCSTC